MHVALKDTIIAQCTPPGTGALSLIRISGNDACAIADRMIKLKGNKQLQELPTHTIHYGSVINNATNTRIDDVLILLMRAPKTFTGEDTIEITSHGNPFIVHDIIALGITHGAQHAQPGEFTQRAVMNGKLDIIRAEAIHELITAQTALALKQSLAQLDGTLSHRMQAFEYELLKALAFTEASFEFIDEEEEFAAHIIALLQPLQHEIQTMLTYTQNKQLIKQGIRIALIGSVNTGKSSLFNALLNNKRSIVSDTAGTTRDTVEALLERQGSFITLIDTAGLRLTDNRIEHEGIQRSYEQAHTADLILLVYDGARAMTTQEDEVYASLWQQYRDKIIPVLTKADLDHQQHAHIPHAISVASPTKQGVPDLEQRIAHRIEAMFAAATSPYILNQRQLSLIQTLAQELEIIIGMLHQPHPAYELIAHHLKNALAQLSTLSGKTISEQGMDLIFREFCVGK